MTSNFSYQNILLQLSTMQQKFQGKKLFSTFPNCCKAIYFFYTACDMSTAASNKIVLKWVNQSAYFIHNRFQDDGCVADYKDFFMCEQHVIPPL